MDLQPPISELGFTCPECQMGTLTPRGVTFAQWYEGQFILIPDFPGWVCDFCGRCEYDAEAIARLEMVLGPEADLRHASPRSNRGGPPNPRPPSRPNRRHRV